MAVGRVLFRVDGGSGVGFGHLMRCLSLAGEMSKRGANIVFAGTSDPAAEIQVQRSGFEWRSLGSVFDRAQDVERIRPMLSGTNLLVVDHYGIDRVWFEGVGDSLPEQVFCIDDLFDRGMNCTALLDQNWLGSENPYRDLVPKDCRFFLGPRYALLRDEFRSLRPKSKAALGVRPLRRLLVSFGAFDPTGETEKVLEAFRCVHRDLKGIELSVLPGPSNPARPRLETEYGMLPGVKFLEPPRQMAALLMEMDLVLGAAGSSVWERCCLGIPSAIVQTAENQKSLIAAASQGIAQVLGRSNDVSVETWIQFFQENLGQDYWQKQRELGYELVDGAGVVRVVDGLFERNAQ